VYKVLILAKITSLSLLTIASIISFKSISAPINLYCDPHFDNKRIREHVSISFDIQSKKAFKLIGYYSSDSVRNFEVTASQIIISMQNSKSEPGDEHIIDRRDLTYTYKASEEMYTYNLGGTPIVRYYDGFSCTKEEDIETQF
jgi:hypothetical protein